jgi:CRP/FNR family cyclic AMP-dependent transcriptional regulator
VAHWAGLSVEKCREVLSQLSTQNKVELSAGRITVKNIHDLKRFVQSRRRER